MKKIVKLTENDLTRIVRKTVKESQNKLMGIPMGGSITIEDIVMSIESELSRNDIDPGWYENEIYSTAKNIMEGFKYQIQYIDENTVFMNLLDNLRNRDGYDESEW
jgi:hypothetical protein